MLKIRGRDELLLRVERAVMVNRPMILTVSEVATLFRVNNKTVGRWVLEGRMVAFRTLGGHHRFRLEDIYPLLEGVQHG